MALSDSDRAKSFLEERRQGLEAVAQELEQKVIFVRGQADALGSLIADLDKPITAATLGGAAFAAVQGVPVESPVRNRIPPDGQNLAPWQGPAIQRRGTVQAHVLAVIREADGTRGLTSKQIERALLKTRIRFTGTTVSATISKMVGWGWVERVGDVSPFRYRAIPFEPKQPRVQILPERKVQIARSSLGTGGKQYGHILGALSTAGNTGLTAAECSAIVSKAMGTDAPMSSIGARFSMMGQAGLLDHEGNRWVLRPEHRITPD